MKGEILVIEDNDQNLYLASVPIVAVTSYALSGDREKALEAGCTGYIEKPINPDTFMQQIEHYLKKTGGRRRESCPEY